MSGILVTSIHLLVVGWAPSQFVSSRQEKASRNSLKPEDFMDEEVIAHYL